VSANYKYTYSHLSGSYDQNFCSAVRSSRPVNKNKMTKIGGGWAGTCQVGRFVRRPGGPPGQS